MRTIQIETKIFFFLNYLHLFANFIFDSRSSSMLYFCIKITLTLSNASQGGDWWCVGVTGSPV